MSIRRRARTVGPTDGPPRERLLAVLPAEYEVKKFTVFQSGPSTQGRRRRDRMKNSTEKQNRRPGLKNKIAAGPGLPLRLAGRRGPARCMVVPFRGFKTA